MQETNIKGINEIDHIFYDFLYENFGEKPSQIKTYMYDNMLTIFAADCFHPGELNFLNIGENWRFVHEVKIKEFDTVKTELRRILEEKTGCNIKRIFSIIEKNGLRFILIVFKENLENRFELEKSEKKQY